MATKTDYYELLGVSKSASSEELKKAYRKEALKWHPDRHSGSDKDSAEKRFKEINEAYQVLSNSQKKQAYDQFGHSAFSPGGGASQGNPFSGGFSGQGSPFSYTYSSSGGNQNPLEDFGDPFQIFEQFFGGGGSPFGASRRRATPRYSLAIDFMDAIRGVEKTVEIEGSKKRIKIPAGIDSGTSISFKDFILTVEVKPHEVFTRNGVDIYVNVDVPYSLAALGGEIKVPTVGGEVKVKIRAGTSSGTSFRLKGQGVQHVRGRGRGDEYVKVNVATPAHLSREQRRSLEELRGQGL